LYYAQAIPIYIWPPTRGIGDTSICPKGPAYLTARGGGDFEWTMIPGGTPNSLSCYECTSPTSRATDTSYYIVTSRANPYCTNTNKDTVRVAVLYAAKFEGQDDTTTCPHHAVSLDLKPTLIPGATYRYKWVPATYLSNDTIPNPICNPTLTTTYRVEVSSNISKCKSYDTILVDVLKGFRIITPDTQICDGGTVPVRVVGDPRYTYTWSSPSLGAGIDNTAIINPNITPSVLGRYKYTLTATTINSAKNWCFDGTKNPPVTTDSVASFYIETQPIPKVTVDEDAKLCFGDTMQMHGVVIPDDYPYTLTWTPGVSMDDPTKRDPIFKGQIVGPNELTLIARSSAGCSDSDKVTLTVFPADFLFVSNDTAICPGDSTQLTLTTVGIRSFTWSPNDKISSAAALNPMVWPVSTKRYYVYGVDTNLCFDTASVLVTVNPAAMITLPDTINLYPGQSYNLNPSTNGLTFAWFPNTGLSANNISNPVATPGVNTRYTVTTSTEAGCTASASIDILVMPDSYIEIPNAFAPGNGNTFKPIYLGVSAIKSFAIYNRWGTKVFETKDASQGWDGQYNGELQPMGAYIYSVEGTSAAGNKFSKHGSVTLMR
jgi:gliding motility-associated-like protein